MTFAPDCPCGGSQADRTPESGKEKFVSTCPIWELRGAITDRLRVCRDALLGFNSGRAAWSAGGPVDPAQHHGVDNIVFRPRDAGA
jgi:hypothetical protein